MLTETQIQLSISGHNERNKELIQTLIGRVQIDQPRVIEHHFWAPDQRSAALLAKSMYEHGFLVTEISPIETNDSGKIWTVNIEIIHSPKDAASPKSAEDFVRLAASFDSDYDGWGTNI